MSRINKPLPYPYGNIFNNKENEIENISEAKNESKSISAASKNSCHDSTALFIAIVVLLLIENNKSS